jgi:hypothetical protein
VPIDAATFAPRPISDEGRSPAPIEAVNFQVLDESLDDGTPPRVPRTNLSQQLERRGELLPPPVLCASLYSASSCNIL